MEYTSSFTFLDSLKMTNWTLPHTLGSKYPLLCSINCVGSMPFLCLDCQWYPYHLSGCLRAIPWVLAFLVGIFGFSFGIPLHFSGYCFPGIIASSANLFSCLVSLCMNAFQPLSFPGAVASTWPFLSTWSPIHLMPLPINTQWLMAMMFPKFAWTSLFHKCMIQSTQTWLFAHATTTQWGFLFLDNLLQVHLLSRFPPE